MARDSSPDGLVMILSCTKLTQKIFPWPINNQRKNSPSAAVYSNKSVYQPSEWDGSHNYWQQTSHIQDPIRRATCKLLHQSWFPSRSWTTCVCFGHVWPQARGYWVCQLASTGQSTYSLWQIDGKWCRRDNVASHNGMKDTLNKHSCSCKTPWIIMPVLARRAPLSKIIWHFQVHLDMWMRAI
jgi:hypothetical protein